MVTNDQKISHGCRKPVALHPICRAAIRANRENSEHDSHLRDQQKISAPDPPSFQVPNSRRLCWYEHDVLAWINSTRPAEPPPPKRPRGRPTKVEQLARARWQELNASIQHQRRTAEPAEPHPPARPQERLTKAERPAYARRDGQNPTVQQRAGGKK